MCTTTGIGTFDLADIGTFGSTEGTTECQEGPTRRDGMLEIAGVSFESTLPEVGHDIAGRAGSIVSDTTDITVATSGGFLIIISRVHDYFEKQKTANMAVFCWVWLILF